MNIVSKFKTYTVDFTEKLDLIHFISDETTFFVIDKNIYSLYKTELNTLPSERLYLLDAVEQKKTINTAVEICDKMTSMPSKRNTHLVSIGGGITQDVTGFVATVLYRGIKWTFFPSTVLAACDSCIGGKTSLNCNGFKNLLGTFYPPDEILIYSEFFKTLSERDFQSGLGEIVKFNVMAGKDGIDKIENNIDKLISRDNGTVSEFCRTSLTFKKSFIEEDEFDRGCRILLNFAHTFGHAFEVSSNYGIPHGSAVAMGMIVANNISVERKILDFSFAARIENVCLKILNLPLDSAWFDFDIIIKAIKKDKKQTDASIKAVLMNRDLSLEVKSDITEDEIKFSLNHLKDLLVSEMAEDMYGGGGGV